MPKRTKAEVQADTLDVLAAWLDRECHNDSCSSAQEVTWACEIQERLRVFAIAEAAKLRRHAEVVPGPARVTPAKEERRVTTSVEQTEPIRATLQITPPDELPRDDLVRAARKAELHWLSTSTKLRTVLGVVDGKDCIEWAYVRQCDPSRADDTFTLWPGDVKLRWFWTKDRGVYSLDDPVIAPKLAARIERMIRRKFARIARQLKGRNARSRATHD